MTRELKERFLAAAANGVEGGNKSQIIREGIKLCLDNLENKAQERPAELGCVWGVCSDSDWALFLEIAKRERNEMRQLLHAATSAVAQFLVTLAPHESATPLLQSALSGSVTERLQLEVLPRDESDLPEIHTELYGWSSEQGS